MVISMIHSISSVIAITVRSSMKKLLKKNSETFTISVQIGKVFHMRKEMKKLNKSNQHGDKSS